MCSAAREAVDFRFLRMFTQCDAHGSSVIDLFVKDAIDFAIERDLNRVIDPDLDESVPYYRFIRLDLDIFTIN